ncbi:MAG TPA: DinB family protein [Trueperaceae bacterium]|nr:DinB family protein [Trueperaceae bacterium]
MTIPAELTIVFESFDRNARVNRATLATLSMDDLTYGDGVGGFNIGQHLADIVNFRPDWLKRVSPEHAARVTDVTDGSDTWLKVKSIAELQAAFDEGDAAMRDAVLDAVRESRSFKGVYETHPAHLMQHCIVHDSHHRGQILALLRQAGRSPEERERLESASWPIWRE